ncbi:hypothetical protein PC41400_08030 [Paenibacillus chitinolyticus]|uniref:Uncharacterized protein n=1 Tax=Paenibacillus chitinolyticus TaxID=79263 RepID=A0A410WTE9_9BACL|nr:hypothetical protein [Paenibacillus chitinolyticus]MCY9594039.1 hypothetical protein [Paenibacillus chitinolyticus]MCY9599144.1 hypothetical protein [Paenibacillus chitinolyticus]QAV17614.1 hypothetical protein PC41400_08030 [Paenibacillus chitinolyticus]
MQKQLVLNSLKTVLSEENSNPLFLEMDILLMRNAVNLNNYYFTESFIDEIVQNQNKYNGLPLVVDLERLLENDYDGLGHQYSEFLNKFFTQQIGNYVSFEKKYDENGIAELHGTARISKRNEDLVKVINELYVTSGLNFSVEVIAQEYRVDENNWLIIDAHPGNLLVSDCLVSVPAEPSSKALKLVAQLTKGGKEKVSLEEMKIEKEKLEAQVATLTAQLNEANQAVTTLGKEKEMLTAQVDDLSKYKNDTLEKAEVDKINALIAEVKESLSEQELTLVNEVAEAKEFTKVQFKVNEICAQKYKESIRLNNSTGGSFFSVTKQKDLGNDELTKFNM